MRERDCLLISENNAAKEKQRSATAADKTTSPEALHVRHPTESHDNSIFFLILLDYTLVTILE